MTGTTSSSLPPRTRPAVAGAGSYTELAARIRSSGLMRRRYGWY
jgi:hypothetical protein